MAYSDSGPAEAMRTWLECEAIPCRVEPRVLANARESQYCVFVPKRLAHRARWLAAQARPSDGELDFLATGKLPGQLEEP